MPVETYLIVDKDGNVVNSILWDADAEPNYSALEKRTIVKSEAALVAEAKWDGTKVIYKEVIPEVIPVDPNADSPITPL